MKSFPVGFLVLLFLFGCSDDQEKLSSEQILMKYNWQLEHIDKEGPVIEEPEPSLEYVVFSFRKTGCYVKTGTDTFEKLTDWTLDGNALTVGDEVFQIISLTKKKLVYEREDESVVTRISIKK